MIDNYEIYLKLINSTRAAVITWNDILDITGIIIEAVKWEDDHYDRPLPRLAARPSQSNPRGSVPELLKRERGHVTSESGVAEEAVFGALQPNDTRNMTIIPVTGLYNW